MNCLHMTSLLLPGTVAPFAGAIDPKTYTLTTGAWSFAPDVRNNSGWILCDGSSILTSIFPQLVQVLGDQYGGDLSAGKVQVPDYRGWFQRGQLIDSDLGAELPDEVKHADEERNSPRSGDLVSKADNATGSRQGEMVQTHLHQALGAAATPVIPNDKGVPYLNNLPQFTESTIFDANQIPISGSETRPVNTYVHYLIFAGGR